MIEHLKQVVPAAVCDEICAKLQSANFVDGRATALLRDENQKRNLQLPVRGQPGGHIAQELTRVLMNNEAFVTATRVKTLTPPRVSKYETGMFYADHLDNVFMGTPKARIRTDISVTICSIEARAEVLESSRRVDIKIILICFHSGL